MDGLNCEILPVFPTPKVGAVYTIADRVYTLYSDGLYYGNDRVVLFERPVYSSTLCGETIAVLLDDSTLVVPSARTLKDSRYWGPQAELILERTGMARRDEYSTTFRYVTADLSGSIICVNLGHGAVGIYEYSAADHTLHSGRSRKLDGDLSLFQVSTAGASPYIWTVSWDAESDLMESENGYIWLDLFDISLLAPPRATPLVRLPLDVDGKDRNDVWTSDVELVPVQDGSLLVKVVSRIFYIPLASAIAGDERPGLLPIATRVWSLSQTQTSQYTRVVYTIDEMGRVFELSIDPLKKRATVSSQPVTATVCTKDPFSFHALPQNSDVLRISRGKLAFNQCELDTSRWPWRALVLDNMRVSVVTPETVVRYAGKVPLPVAEQVLKIIQVPRLKTIFISTPSGLGWSSPHPGNFGNIENSVMLAAGVIEGFVMFAFDDRVELRRPLAPEVVVSPWFPGKEELILDANIGPAHCLLRLPDRVVSLRICDGSIQASELLTGHEISFVRCDGSRSIVGVAVNDMASHDSLIDLCTAETTVIGKLYSFIGADAGAGATLCFNEEGSSLVELRFHRHLPTDMVRLPEGWAVILYRVEGQVGIFPDKGPPTFHNVMGTVNVAEQFSAQRGTVILYGGSGLWAATREGLRLVRDNKSRKSGEMVQCACVLDDGTVAYVARGDLRFLCAQSYYGHQLPHQVEMLSHNAKKTTMLLVPSKRIAIVHGKLVCSFLDSVTLEPLLVNGLRSHLCDEIRLWQFELDGKPYEHLVFASGKSVIESYTIERVKNEVTLTRKLRFIARDGEEYSRLPEILLCSDRYIYLARHDYLIKTCPMENQRWGPIYFDSEVRFVTQVDKWLIVSTIKSINIVDAESFRILAKRNEPRGISGHAGGMIYKDGCGWLYILVALKDAKFQVLVFCEDDQKLSSETLHLGPISESHQRVRSFSQSSNWNIENGFCVIAIMQDSSVRQIALRGPDAPAGARSLNIYSW